MPIFRDKMGRSLSAKDAKEKIINRFNNYWLDFKLMLLRWAGHVPLHNFRKLFYTLSGMKIGKKSTIHIGANFYQPKNIKIGDDTIVGNNSFLDGRASLIIGNHVDIASEIMIFNSEHDVSSGDFDAIEDIVEISDYVFIGPRVIILPGVKIGKGAIVAAGSVVTKSIQPFKIVAGVPANVIGERKQKELHYRLGRARLFQ